MSTEPSKKPIRVQVLDDAARLTHGNRDREYGRPYFNLRAAGDLKHVMRKHARAGISSAEWEALDMIQTKIARYIVGNPKRDTCVDMSAYSAILWENHEDEAAMRGDPLAACRRGSEEAEGAAMAPENLRWLFADLFEDTPLSDEDAPPSDGAAVEAADVQALIDRLRRTFNLEDAGLLHISIMIENDDD